MAFLLCVPLAFPSRVLGAFCLVIIDDVFGHEPFQVALVEYDHGVERIVSAVADESLSNAILPGASGGWFA